MVEKSYIVELENVWRIYEQGRRRIEALKDNRFSSMIQAAGSGLKLAQAKKPSLKVAMVCFRISSTTVYR